MIAVDTSALMTIILREPDYERCIAALSAEDEVVISAGTVAELLVVATRRSVLAAAERLLNEYSFEVIPVTAAFARRIGQAHGQWGKGVHPAGLNFGDCFAYSLAIERGCPLLFVGRDFAATDVAGALDISAAD